MITTIHSPANPKSILILMIIAGSLFSSGALFAGDHDVYLEVGVGSSLFSTVISDYNTYLLGKYDVNPNAVSPFQSLNPLATLLVRFKINDLFDTRLSIAKFSANYFSNAGQNTDSNAYRYDIYENYATSISADLLYKLNFSGKRDASDGIFLPLSVGLGLQKIYMGHYLQIPSTTTNPNENLYQHHFEGYGAHLSLSISLEHAWADFIIGTELFFDFHWNFVLIGSDSGSNAWFGDTEGLKPSYDYYNLDNGAAYHPIGIGIEWIIFKMAYRLG